MLLAIVNAMRKKKGNINAQIRRMVRRIVKRFAPEQIILFGSHARGNATPDSDVDLLVVMPVEGSKLEKEVQLRLALHDIRVPVDVIISRPEDVGEAEEARPHRTSARSSATRAFDAPAL